MTSPVATHRRILVIDDNRAIHDDFAKILADQNPLAAAEARLFGTPDAVSFELDFASQGAEGLNLVHRARAQGRPYAVAFVDVRMPPGWDGVETSRRIWEVDPDLQIVICTAYSDYSWHEMTKALGEPDRLLILKKPFDSIEVMQLAHSLTDKWRLLQESKRTVSDLEQAVSERTAKLQALLDAATHVSIIATDTEGYIRVFNSGAELMLGYRADEMVGLHTPELIHDPAECRARSVQLTKECGRPVEGFEVFVEHARNHPFEQREWTYVRKDGSRLDVNLIVTAVRDSSGAIGGYLGIATDITVRKRLEADLLVNNEKLAEQTRRAEAASRAKSDFLATMSHEIRTPMNGVVGMTELLLLTDLSDEQRQYAQLVAGSADALLTVINDILDFSKVESGKLDLESIDFELRTTLEEAAELVSGRAVSKGLEMTCLISPDTPSWVRGDPGRLRQVVTNLLGNAIKFTEAGDVVLRATVADESTDDVMIRVAISDTGIGIAEEARSRLFQSFSQADASMTRRFGGTGLGLAISKRLAELMGGEIGVESEPGKGSTFWFTVRLGKTPADRIVPGTPRDDLRGLHALAVDDHQANLDLVRGQTRAWGMTCDTVTNGADALRMIDAARAHPYDVVITDMHMPGMDGLELAESIRRDPSNAATKLVLMTSMAHRGTAVRSQEAGIAAYLTKPVRQAQLYECLRVILGTSSPAAAPAEVSPRAVPRSGGVAASPQAARVLLAEDNQTNQMTAVRMLGRLGYLAEVAANGVDAVKACREGTFALVLMDSQMPEMDGLTTAREIRAFERAQGRRRVPIVAVTANAMQGDREKCLAAGMDDYLSKPFKVAQLEEVLSRWCQVQRSAVMPEVGVSPAAEASPIDATTLNEYRDMAGEDGGEFVARVIDQYLTEAASLLTRIKDAIEGDDARALKLAAHSLKGASRTIGAPTMAGLSEKMEAIAGNGTCAGGASLLLAIDTEFERVQPALRLEQEARPSVTCHNALSVPAAGS